MRLCPLSFNALAAGALAFAFVPVLQTAPAAPKAGTTPAAPKSAPQAAPTPAKAPAKPDMPAKGDKAAADAKAMAKVGEKAPDFTLKDSKDESVTLSKILADKKVVVLEWFNPDCPVSKGYHGDDSIMSKLAADYHDKGVVWLAINSGGPGNQGAGKERNMKALEEYGIKYPVLLDENGKIGKEYGAKTTPHMFIIDKDGVLRYAGAIDNGSPDKHGDTNYVKAALDELLAGKEVTKKETRAFGCGVKYAE